VIAALANDGGWPISPLPSHLPNDSVLIIAESAVGTGGADISNQISVLVVI